MSLKRRPPVGNCRRVAAIGTNVRGVMTNKAGRAVQFESFLERSLLLRLDRDRTVRDYGSQPETFPFIEEGGRRRSYTPDFIVWREDGAVEIHEVTLASRRTRPALRAREAAAAAICRERGWEYVVHTEQNLPQDAELANLLALCRYRPSAYAPPDLVQAVLACLVEGQPATGNEITRRLNGETTVPRTDLLSTIYHLLWHGRLETDLHQLLFVQGVMAPHVTLWLASEESAPCPAN